MHLNSLFAPKTKTIAEEAICKTFVIFAFSQVGKFSHDCCEDVANNYAANFPKAMDPVAPSQTTEIPVPKTRENFNFPRTRKKAEHPVFLKQTQQPQSKNGTGINKETT